MSPDRTRTGRLILRHPIAAMFVSLILVIGVPVGVALWVGHDKDVKLEQANERFVDYQVTSAAKGCRNSNRGRKALQTVLDRAAKPPETGAATIDFSTVPGFDAIDPTVQIFLNSLEVRLNQPTTNANLQDIADDYRRTNPSNINCAALAAELRRKLEA